MANLWKTLGLTATLAAGFGMVGATSYQAALRQNASVQTEADTQTESAAQTAAQVSTAAKEETSTASVKQTSDSTNSEGETLTVRQVAANSMPAMVAITNTSVQEVRNYFGGYGFGSNGQSQTVESVSAGTGVIIGETDEKIRIITNAHVIADADTLSVAFVDETAASAEVIGSDTSHDIAVIEVKKSDLSESTLSAIKVISIGSSDETQVGEEVVAIGNALGYGQSVSAGIISAKDRTIQTQGSSYGDVQENEGLFQTDAAINPGNSGGALLNRQGELIAINSAKYADESVEGMGYAIPIDTAMPIVNSLIEGASSTKATTMSAEGGVSLGITGATITEEYAQYYDIPQGVYIKSVESDSAAASAGIQTGDIITAIDGQSISSIEELKSKLASYQSGDKADITVSRSAGLDSQFGQNRTVYRQGTLTVHLSR